MKAVRIVTTVEVYTTFTEGDFDSPEEFAAWRESMLSSKTLAKETIAENESGRLADLVYDVGDEKVIIEDGEWSDDQGWVKK